MKCHPLVVKYLLGPAVKLFRYLQEKEPVFFIFDEVKHLFEDKEGDILYSALRRVLRLLGDHPIWALFLSTQSHVQYFVQADSADPSSQIRNRYLVRVESFYGLEVDIEMGKPLSQFATLAYLLHFSAIWPCASSSILARFQRITQEVRTMFLPLSPPESPWILVQIPSSVSAWHEKL